MARVVKVGESVGAFVGSVIVQVLPKVQVWPLMVVEDDAGPCTTQLDPLPMQRIPAVVTQGVPRVVTEAQLDTGVGKP